MLPLRRPQLRDDRVEGQLVHGCAVDAPDQRIAQPRDERRAEPPAQESADREVLGRRPARKHEVPGHRELLQRREQAGPDERRQPGREDQPDPVRHRHEATARADVDDARVGRADDVAAQAQLTGERGGCRPVRDERVRAVLQQEAVDALRADLAAEAVGGLVQVDRDPRAGQLPCRGEPGDATTGDDDGHAVAAQARPGTNGQSGSASR
jgi:hypothetical protein